MNKSHKKVLFIGGHSTPAFAVLDELMSDVSNNIAIHWAGEKYNQRGNKNLSQEYVTVTGQYNLPFHSMRSGKLQREWTMRTFLTGFWEMFWLQIGFINALFIIMRLRPNVVMSFGGFIAVPLVIWARIFGSKVITHEQTVVVGLANKIIAKFSNRICVSWESSLKYFPKNKTVFTGNPIRSSIFEINSNITSGMSKDKPLVYITGGNQGAHEINKRIFPIVSELLKSVKIVHQTGNSTVTNDYSKAVSLKDALPSDLKKDYLVFEYIDSDGIGEVMNKADLIVSRAGANTISEILVLGKMSVLIPIPWASHNEQNKNADFVARIGLAMKLEQDEGLTPDLLHDAIVFGLDNKAKNSDYRGNKLADTIKGAKEQVNLNAAKQISSIITEYFD